ncbi:MAG: methyltransferase domain-containing protein [Planctomycetaceae bacterium]|nr:methyltransferase domain-containing protein [Planctomycetaceae bacterium]
MIRNRYDMRRAIRDHLAFFRQFRQRFETTGAIAPSSSFLAKSMTRYLGRRRDEAVRVLEIGPGTGPVTAQIVGHLKSGDHFDLVELNESFVEILNNRFRDEDDWRRVAPFSEIHQRAVQDFVPEMRYDFVISGLPLNNFPADLVETITEAYFRLLKPGGVLSYFEYMYVRPIRRVVSSGDERIRIRRIDEIMQEHCRRHRIRRDNIWINLPPAWVQHLQTAVDE